MSRTDAILKRLTTLYPRFLELDLGRERLLLDKLGRPQDRLPPVIHVAGTNAKGSTIAYLRAMLDAAGKRIHVYPSQPLVPFTTRLRLTIEHAASKLRITPIVHGRDYDSYAQDGRLIYQDEDGLIDLPSPALIGHHQYDNAGIAIAAVRHFKLPISDKQIAEGLRTVTWPARIQPLKGKLRDLLPRSSELWLDGAHNAHGAAALALSLPEMTAARPKPLVLIVGMMTTREPAEFLAPFVSLAPRVLALAIPG